MAAHKLRIAKADDADIEEVTLFFRLYEMVLSNKWKEFDINDLNEDDEDRKHLQKFIIKESDEWAKGSVGDFDYTAFFEDWQERIGHRWRRVVMGCEIMIANACDPTEDHLAFYPGIEFKHVENEQ